MKSLCMIRGVRLLTWLVGAFFVEAVNAVPTRRASLYRYNSYENIVARLHVNNIMPFCPFHSQFCILTLKIVLQALNTQHPNLVQLYNAQEEFGVPSPGSCSETQSSQPSSM